MNTTITTPELFRLLSISIGKEKPATPYMVAKVLGVTPTTAGYWMRGATVMNEKDAIRAADMLQLDPEYVILSLEAERKSRSGLDEIAAIFERAALAVAHHGQAASIGFAVALSFIAMGRAVMQVCILCKTRYRKIPLQDWLLDLWDGELPHPA